MRVSVLVEQTRSGLWRLSTMLSVNRQVPIADRRFDVPRGLRISNSYAGTV